MKDYFLEAMKLLRNRKVFGIVSIGEIEKLAQRLYETDCADISNKEILRLIRGR